MVQRLAGWLERVAVTLAKNPFVRFDLIDYSVPHTHVGRLLTVLADPYEVDVADAGAGWGTSSRGYDLGNLAG